MVFTDTGGKYFAQKIPPNIGNAMVHGLALALTPERSITQILMMRKKADKVAPSPEQADLN
jgi:hypothetical protein